MLTINIQIDPRDKSDTLDLHLAAIGFFRSPAHAAQPLPPADPFGVSAVSDAIEKAASPAQTFGQAFLGGRDDAYATGASAGGDLTVGLDVAQPGADKTRASVATEAELLKGAELVGVSTKREPGKPAPGHRRRTNAEIAEDEAYFAKIGKKEPGPVSEAEMAALTGGEEVEESSIFGDASSDSADVYSQSVIDHSEGNAELRTAAAQDKADEAAETAAAKAQSGGKLTLDDLRNAVGAYQKLHGPLKAIKDIPVILGKAIVEVKDDELEEAIRKVKIATEVPVVTTAPAVAQHIEENKPEEAKPATIEDVKAALARYAMKYDGRADLGKDTTPITNADGSKIVKDTVGAENLAAMPKDAATLARFIAAIDKAVAENPFNRAVKQ